MTLALSIALALLGAVAQLWAGRDAWQGWALGLAIQPVWIVFAVLSGGYGLILCSVLYAGVAWRNLVVTRRRQQAPVKPTHVDDALPVLSGLAAMPARQL